MKSITESELWAKAFQDVNFETRSGSVKASGQAATIFAIAFGLAFVGGVAYLCKERACLRLPKMPFSRDL